MVDINDSVSVDFDIKQWLIDSVLNNLVSELEYETKSVDDFDSVEILSYPKDSVNTVAVMGGEFFNLNNVTGEKAYLTAGAAKFYIRYLIETEIHPRMKGHVYTFESYLFFNILHKKRGKGPQGVKIFPDRLSKWHSIFDHEVILAPIVLDGHWHVALICFINDFVGKSREVRSTLFTGAIRKPTIFWLDSQNSIVFQNEFSSTIREFLQRVWDSIPDHDIVNFQNMRLLPNRKVNIPEQRDSTNCGLIMLAVLEIFLRNPRQNLESMRSSYGFKKLFKPFEIPISRRRIQQLILDNIGDPRLKKRLVVLLEETITERDRQLNAKREHEEIVPSSHPSSIKSNDSAVSYASPRSTVVTTEESNNSIDVDAMISYNNIRFPPISEDPRFNSPSALNKTQSSVKLPIMKFTRSSTTSKKPEWVATTSWKTPAKDSDGVNEVLGDNGNPIVHSFRGWDKKENLACVVYHGDPGHHYWTHLDDIDKPEGGLWFKFVDWYEQNKRKKGWWNLETYPTMYDFGTGARKRKAECSLSVNDVLESTEEIVVGSFSSGLQKVVQKYFESKEYSREKGFEPIKFKKYENFAIETRFLQEVFDLWHCMPNNSDYAWYNKIVGLHGINRQHSNAITKAEGYIAAMTPQAPMRAAQDIWTQVVKHDKPVLFLIISPMKTDSNQHCYVGLARRGVNVHREIRIYDPWVMKGAGADICNTVSLMYQKWNPRAKHFPNKDLRIHGNQDGGRDCIELCLQWMARLMDSKDIWP